MTNLDRLNLVGSVASIVGLGVSAYTLYKVETLPSALRSRSRDQQLTDLIDEVVRASETRAKLPVSVAEKADFIVQALREHYISRLPFRHRARKRMLAALEKELSGEKRREIIRNQFLLIQSEFFTR